MTGATPRWPGGRHARAPLVGLALVLGACVRYLPQPVQPAEHAAAYRARRLDDTLLLAWVGRFGPAPKPGRWTERQMALAALATRAELRRARADWRAARQGERRAGWRPQPGLQTEVERAVSGSEGASPWVVGLAATLSIELGGKRGARLAQARARTAVVEAELRRSAWSVAVAARDAAAGVAVADQDLSLARRQVDVLTRVATLEQGRFDEGSLTAAEVARTRAEVQDAIVEATAAEASALEARAALAGALAMPARALDSVAVTSSSSDRCAGARAIGSDSLAALALGHRPEMGRALADYAVAEADLRVEVARQFPDVDLGPGFIWDQGVHRWTLALALPNLLGFRNHTAIDEAAAVRAATAAHVAEVQDALLAELDLAVARCRGAVLERAAADSQVAIASRAAALAKAAYDRGETSGLDPALGELATVRAARARRAAEVRQLRAGRALDQALGSWTDDPGARWPDPRAPGLDESESP